eukprot:COSAG02_NODE_3034_length_7504_cov_13.653477_4_plen_55_part_00
MNDPKLFRALGGRVVLVLVLLVVRLGWMRVEGQGGVPHCVESALNAVLDFVLLS